MDDDVADYCSLIANLESSFSTAYVATYYFCELFGSITLFNLVKFNLFFEMFQIILSKELSKNLWI